MENVEFNPGEPQMYGGGRRPVAHGGLTGLFMKLFGLTDENKASGVMLVVAVAFFILSGLILWWFL